jgi:hypothetical protein
MREEILQLALNEQGKIVSIFQVPSGLECKCFCPLTGARLIAKNNGKQPNIPLKPNQKVAHFARIDGFDVPIGATESAIHLLAKEVFLKYKIIITPPLINNGNLLKKSVKVEFDEVTIEWQNAEFNYRPDAIAYKKNKKLLVEFCNTHAVDQEKIEKIKNSGISCVEIDLSNISPLDIEGNPNEEGIIERLYDSKYSIWIYNNREEFYLKSLQQNELKNENQNQNQKRIIPDDINVKSPDLETIKRLEKEYLEQGYEFLEIYVFEKFSWDENYNEHTGFSKWRKSIEYVEKYIYCPREKMNNKNKKISSDECLYCNYFKEYHKEYYTDVNYAVCGYKNKLKSKK